jgi:hypothetical protein
MNVTIFFTTSHNYTCKAHFKKYVILIICDINYSSIKRRLSSTISHCESAELIIQHCKTMRNIKCNNIVSLLSGDTKFSTVIPHKSQLQKKVAEHKVCVFKTSAKLF